VQPSQTDGYGEDEIMAKPPGLYANINAKKKRIKAGSDEKMRKPGSKGAPTAKAFRESAKTAKKRS
jgi:hypothetical protein